jgi:hypothetical protein
MSSASCLVHPAPRFRVRLLPLPSSVAARPLLGFRPRCGAPAKVRLSVHSIVAVCLDLLNFAFRWLNLGFRLPFLLHVMSDYRLAFGIGVISVSSLLYELQCCLSTDYAICLVDRYSWSSFGLGIIWSVFSLSFELIGMGIVARLMLQKWSGWANNI